MQTLSAALGLPHSGALQWVHGVNTPEALQAACADPLVHVLEADVFFEDADATPLIKPRAGATTELDLTAFILSAQRAHKGVKLDFRNAAAIEPTLALLRLLNPVLPPILHADVFTLLAGKTRTESMEPEQFLRLVASYMPKALISLGWSLKRSHDADGRMEEALIMQLAAMLAQRLGPSAYALEIRAGYRPTRDGVPGERGAAMILEPLPPAPPAYAESAFVFPQGGNVVSLLPRLRRVA